MSADTALVVIDAQIGVVGEANHHDEVLFLGGQNRIEICVYFLKRSIS